MKFFATTLRANIFFLFFVSAFLKLVDANGQTTITSPYSRFGIGDIQQINFSKFESIGKSGLASLSPFGYNLNAPSSLSDLALTTFDAGANASFIEIKSSEISQKNYNSGFRYLSFAFPVISRKWGMAISLQPYSNVGYSLIDTVTDVQGLEKRDYLGTGGFNRFMFSSGIKLKDFRIGASVSYLFGGIDQQRKLTFANTSYVNTRVIENITANDFYLNGSLSYTFDSLNISPSDSIIERKNFVVKTEKEIKILSNQISDLQSSQNDSSAAKISLVNESLKALQSKLDSVKNNAPVIFQKRKRGDWNLTFALAASPNQNLSVSKSNYISSWTIFGTNEVTIDTLFYQKKSKLPLVLPNYFSGGLSLQKGNRWLISLDASMQDWSKFSLDENTDTLKSSMTAGFGIQFTPKDRDDNNYFNVIQYRLGGYYKTDYLQLRSTQLNEYGITAGLGFPFKRSAGIIHLGVQAGKKGTTKNNLIEENFTRLWFGVTLSDRWFIKPKID